MTSDGGTDFYAKLGVRPVINAWGVATELGGWTPSPVVVQAMEEAGKHQVEMVDLLERSGDFIADLLGVEAAYVTSGAAAGQALGVAACMAGSDPGKIARLPDTEGMKNEVLIQKRNRYMFDRCFTLTGAKIAEAGDEEGTTPEQLDQAIGPNTAAVAYWIQPPVDEAIVGLDDLVKQARARGVPAFADACSQIYPLDYFRKNAQSADLVTFGAKYLGAPHSVGFVCGKRDLIDAVADHSFVAYHYDGGHAVGRAMKIDRQEIVGVVAAMDAWFTMDHEERILGYEARFSKIESALAQLEGVRPERPEIHHYVNQYMDLVLDTELLGTTADQVRAELDSGNPRIWVAAKADDVIGISGHTMNDGEEDILIDRLVDILSRP